MASIIDKIAQIRQAVFGKDVRESIASGIEAINVEVESTTARQNVIDLNEAERISAENTRIENENIRIEEHTQQTTEVEAIKVAYDAATKANLSVEVSNARTDNISNTTYQTLGERLDGVSSSLAEMANVRTIISFGGKVDGVFDNKDALFSAITWLKSGTGNKLVIPPGTLYTSEQINLTGLGSVYIECFAKLKTPQGIYISGSDYDLRFDVIEGDKSVNPLTLSNAGIYFDSTCRGKVKAKRIEGFRYASKLIGDPEKSIHGVIYLELDVDMVNTCDYACYATTINNPSGATIETAGYVNENIIRIKQMECNNGIIFSKGANQVDRFNNNKIEYAGLEQIINDGITFEFAKGNIIYEPRYEHVGGITIKEIDTYDNKYIVSYPMPEGSIQLGKHAQFLGSLYDTYGARVFKSIITDDNAKPTYNNTDGVQTLTNASGFLNPTTKVVNVEASTSAVGINMSKYREYEGSILYINATVKTNTIAIKNSSGNTDIADIGTTIGVYLIMYFNSKWHSTKISDTPFN